MKKYFNQFFLLTTLSLMLWSCEKDEVKTILKQGAAPTLNASATTLTLLQANAANDAVSFTWTAADYGFSAPTSYTLQIAVRNTNFAGASRIDISMGNSLTKSFKVGDINRELLKIIPAGITSQLEARVKVDVASSVAPVYSNVVNLTATPYRDIIKYNWPYAINVAGNYQNWSPSTAPQIVSVSNDGNYEGYINFNNPTPEFKFVKGDNWGAGDFGSAGGNNLGDGGPNLTLSNGAGVYLIRANTNNRTWSNTKITRWGLIGSATPGGWGSDQEMNFDAATGSYSITINLVVGEIKFRANNDWAINFGDNNGDLKPDYGGSNIAISQAGNYTIILDIGIAGNYAYSIKKN